MKPYIHSKLLSISIIAIIPFICQGMAVVKDPVIEMNNSFPPPFNPSASPDVKSCPRAHQGLYNELVDCIEQNGDCVKIAYNNTVYGFDAETNKALNTFWAYKKFIASIMELPSDVLQTIPNMHYAQEPTIVLIYPWQKFSVGTRFRHMPEHDTSSAYAIIRADYAANSVILDFVSRQNALLEIEQDSKSARKLFVKIINELIDRVAQEGSNNVIPYVWGGSSFVQPYIQPDFCQKDGTWHRAGKSDPYTGYDCSEFVMRMAQIAGIKFPWKTTTAIHRSKRAFNEKDQLEEGDLIWVQGHIMII